MIVVKKSAEPKELKTLREECLAAGLPPKESFAMLRNPLKQKVLESLKRDQGQLCVYCMCRIPREPSNPEEMEELNLPRQTIEHFIPLETEDGRDIGQGLDYLNLFAVCHGNAKRHKKGLRRINSKDDLTCDKHRENTRFRKIDPCHEETLQTIFYTMDGKIGATDPDVEFDLVSTLNLNCLSSPIVSERKAVLDALIEDMSSAMGNIDELEMADLHKYCEDKLNVYLNEKDPKTPYVGILVWYLKSMAEASS